MDGDNGTIPHKPQRKVREIRMEGHTSAEGLMLETKFGYLSCEIVVKKTKDVKIDEERMNAILEKKWAEIFTEISSLVERPPR